MRFERHYAGEKVWDAMMPGHPGFTMYCAFAGDWQFVISLDQLHGTWSASYQPRHPKGRVSSIQCEDPPPGERLKHYDSQTLAEIACVKKYRQLRQAN
jgi:hypothetical protein